MSDFSQQAVKSVLSLHPYIPGKPIEELEREYGVENIIKLASNENPLGPSPRALEAIANESADIWLYPDGNGFELKTALAQKHQVDVKQITLGNGSSEPLEYIIRAFVNPGDEVLFSQHSFAIYPILTQAVGGVGVAAKAKHWGYDLEAIKAAISDKTKVIFIANPNNPTGTWLKTDDLYQFIKSVPEQIIVVIDEAYFEYASAEETGAMGDFPDSMQWISEFPNLMVTRTFSKAYGLAGLRVGYAVSNPQVADFMNRIRPPFNVNSLALAAAKVALKDEAHIQQSIKVNAAGLRQFEHAFNEMGLEYIPSVANFISVDLKRPAADTYEALLRSGVIVRPVANYAMPNHLRITVGTESQNNRCIQGLKQALQA
jgi:histidinol-phosphate aminotransferase